MYSNNFYPDGLTEQAIDLLIAEAFESADQAVAAPTSALLNGPAERRRNRRIERSTVSSVVRTFPASRLADRTDGKSHDCRLVNPERTSLCDHLRPALFTP